VSELIPLSLLTRAAEQTIATIKRNPWIVLVTIAAIGLGTLADWLLAPFKNLGLIIAAPIKALLWAVTFHVLRRAVIDETLSRLEIEAELVSRMRSLSALAVPLLFGSIAFLALAYGGFVSLVFVFAFVALPVLEWALFGSQKGFGTLLERHGKSWAVTHVIGTAVVTALWLVAVMVSASVHLLAGEIVSAALGGPLFTVVWLVRGHAYLILDTAPDAAPKAAPGRKLPPSKKEGPPAPKAPPAKPVATRRQPKGG